MFGRNKENKTKQKAEKEAKKAAKAARKAEKKALVPKYPRPETPDEILYNEAFLGETYANIIQVDRGYMAIIYDRFFDYARAKGPGYHFPLFFNKSIIANTKEIVGAPIEFKGNTKEGAEVGMIVELKYQVINPVEAWQNADNIFTSIRSALDNVFTQIMSHRSFFELKDMSLTDLNHERKKLDSRLQAGEITLEDHDAQLTDIDELKNTLSNFAEYNGKVTYGMGVTISAKKKITGKIAQEYEDVEKAKVDQTEAYIRLETETTEKKRRIALEKLQRETYFTAISTGAEKLYKKYKKMGMTDEVAQQKVTKAIEYQIATNSGNGISVLNDSTGTFTTAVAAQGAVKKLGGIPQE